MKTGYGIIMLASLAGLAGCSTYRAQPLSRSAVDQALAPPDPGALKIAAARFKHPLIAPVTIDGRDGFTPDEIAILAVIVSPELRALRDQRGVAEAQVVQAGILPNPQLAYGYDRPHGNGDPTLVPAKSLGLSWDLSALLTHRALKESAQRAARSVDLSVAWQEWQAAQAARLQAFRLISLHERLPLARAVEEGLADTRDRVRQAVALGQKTLPDLTVATKAWTDAEDARLELEQDLAETNAALGLELGLPPGEKVPLRPAAPFPDFSATPAEAASLLGGLEDRRLDLVALREGYGSQEAALRAAVWAQFPKIGLAVNQARDTTPVKTRGYAVTVDVPIFDRNQGQVALARATRQQLFDEYVARVADARSQVGLALAQLAMVRRELEAVNDSLPELERMNQGYARAAQGRNGDFMAARDAAGALAARRIERSQLQQQAIELGVALEIATARPLLNRPPAGSAPPS
jgi:outer membrane protein TolC